MSKREQEARSRLDVINRNIGDNVPRLVVDDFARLPAYSPSLVQKPVEDRVAVKTVGSRELPVCRYY